MPKFLDDTGLNKYHENVIKALNQKADKVHVGVSTPTESYIDTWIDTTDEGETQEISLMSLDEEELTFNEDSNEDLTFNEEDGVVATSEDSEELTFNEDI